ncbi:MAG: hypothetical protein IJD48_00990, partial [Clostridia bacterium]|nr:hypothetical protein [Clostridia bacterium]
TGVEISNCVNNGKVTGISRGVGGIVGRILSNTSVTITSCSNAGDVDATGAKCVVTYNESQVNRYYAAVGGIVGLIEGGNTTTCSITSCVNNGTVKVGTAAVASTVTATTSIGGTNITFPNTATKTFYAGTIVGVNNATLSGV